MKSIFLVIFTLSGLAVSGQQSSKPELSISLNAVEPQLPLGNLHFEDKYLDGGDYMNKSIAIGLTGKYFFNETEALRLKFIYTSRNIRDIRDIRTGVHSIYDEKFRQILIKFSPGYQWTFNKNKISFLGGIELPFTIIGKTTQHEYVLDEALDGSTKEEFNTVYYRPGGFSAGIGAFLGSNYFFTKHVAIGFELSSAYQYTSVGGTISYISNITGTNGNSTNTSQHKESIKQFKFSMMQTGINLTVKF